MRFDLVKDNGKTVRLEWTSGDGLDDVRSVLTSKDRPHPDLARTIKGFAAPMRKVLGLPEDFELDVRQVKVTYDGEGEAENVLISAVHPVEGSPRPANIPTPLLAIEKHPAFSELVERLHAEAELYAMRKKREQADLDEEIEASTREAKCERCGWSVAECMCKPVENEAQTEIEQPATAGVEA